ncbi:MAG: hypothetical protein JST25_09420, partial [Actinobacteria bacterium]|nr:hypothetical protein [Actinomycetota bacterium]
MILQPVIAPFLAILLVLPVLAAAVWMLVRSLRPSPVPERAKRDEGRSGTAKRDEGRPGAGPVMWVLRILLVLACGVLLLRPSVPGGQV